MRAEVTRQIYLFLLFIVNGCIIGILFDIFRILRKTFKTSDIITSLQDILFCILTGIFLIYTIFIFNNGEIRLYVIAGLSIGLILYIFLLSEHIIKISVIIINFLKKFLFSIFNFIVIPIKIIFFVVKKPCILIFINIRKFMSKIMQINIKIFKKRKKSKNIKNNKFKEGF